MDQISIKNWLLIGAIGMLLFGSYFLRMGVKRSSWAPPAATFSYEMPRPKNFEPAFDLSDRTVDRQYKTLPQFTPAKAAAAAVTAKTPAQTAAAAKIEAAKKAFATKAAAAQKAAAARKKKAEVKVVDTSRSQDSGGLESAADDSANQYNGNAYQPPQKTAAAPKLEEETEEKEKEEDDALSVAQWRALMQMAPTPKNIARFVKSKQRGKIESAGYYQIVHELLIDSAEDRRKAALTILDADASASSFAFMVTETEMAPADVQASLKIRIEGYSEPSKFSFLIRVLNSNQPVPVLAAAAERLAKALTQFKQLAQNMATETPATPVNNMMPPTPGQATRRLAGGLTAQHFLSFVSTLQKLSKHTNGTLASQATTLLAEIQGLTKATT